MLVELYYGTNHDDCVLQVTWLVLPKKIVLFTGRVVMLLRDLIISSSCIKGSYHRCTPTYTDQIFLGPIFVSFTDKKLQNSYAILCKFRNFFVMATSKKLTTQHGFTNGVSMEVL